MSRVPGRLYVTAVVFALAVGAVYTLSPLSIWFAAAVGGIMMWARRGLDADDRRFVTTVLVVAIALRVLAVAALFVASDHGRIPFGSFFGDEEYFIKRSIWLRNVALGVPIHAADLIYAFDEYSDTSYLYVLAFIQVLVGPSPYGVHLVGIASYVGGVVMLYRLLRPAFGRTPAALALLMLLFLPSMFAWSISALKEPLFFLLATASLVLAARMARAPGWPQRAAAAAGVVAIAAVLATIRQAGGFLSFASVLVGLAIAALVARPRLMLATAVATPLVVGAALARPTLQMRAYAAVQAAARQHWGHVLTPGYAYHLLDDRFYVDVSTISDMQFAEAARFVVRAYERYVTVPWPWEIQSHAAMAYVPEQIVWYALVALLPVGVLFAFRRDVVLAGLLVGHALVAASIIALTSGNIGTVVRHRGLALPYIVALSAVGACELIARAAPRGFRPREPLPFTVSGDSIIEARVWP